MKEWPTRVRTGSPPAARIVSGTTHEQIRLCTILAPGSARSIETATIAVSSEPLTSSACSSTRNTRSASPSKASPTSAPCSSTAAFRSFWFSGFSGSAGWFGKVPSSSAEQVVRGDRQPLEHRRHDEPAHPVRGVGDDDERPHRVHVDEPQHVLDVGVEQVPLLHRPAVGRRREPRLDQRPDIAQPRVLPDGACARPAELQPVVLLRVVARGDHDARQVERAAREVQEIGRRETEVDHVGTLRGDTLGERGGEVRRRRDGSRDRSGSGDRR